MCVLVFQLLRFFYGVLHAHIVLFLFLRLHGLVKTGPLPDEEELRVDKVKVLGLRWHPTERPKLIQNPTSKYTVSKLSRSGVSSTHSFGYAGPSGSLMLAGPGYSGFLVLMMKLPLSRSPTAVCTSPSFSAA